MRTTGIRALIAGCCDGSSRLPSRRVGCCLWPVDRGLRRACVPSPSTGTFQSRTSMRGRDEHHRTDESALEPYV
jgi:hypothetical protein